MRGRMNTENRKNNRSNITQASLTMRILAGGYLLYLVYQMVRGLPESAGSSRIVTLVGIVLFLLLGVILLGHSLYLLKTGNYDKDGENKDNKGDGEEN